MKLTKKKLVALIEQEVKDLDGDRRPWYHGPWESDWDREQKEEECRDGDQEMCQELEADEDSWNRVLVKITGSPATEMIEEEIEESKGKSRRKYSRIKPWNSATVYFNKSAGAKPIAPRMVRLRASVDHSGTKSMKKNYQQNTISLLIMRDTIDLQGNYTAQPLYVKLPGKAVEPDEEGRFFDIEGWRLKKLGLTDQYNNLLDNQGNILATKKQQNKFSGA